MEITSLYSRFLGEFYACPDEVKELKAKLEKGGLDSEQMIYLSDEVKEKDRKYAFDMDVLRYDQRTGLFLATGEDHFGPSVIMGLDQDDRIKFVKVYRRQPIKTASGCFRLPELELSPLTFSDDTNNLRKFDFFGDTKIIGNKIEVIGSYSFRGENFKDGFWHMVPV